MHFLAESLTGEITLMFISYLIFCTVLMYLFVKTDREWGQLEVSLDDVGQREPHAMATTMRYTALATDDRSLFNNGLTRPSLQHCAQYHDIDCTCFMQEQKQQD